MAHSSYTQILKNLMLWLHGHFKVTQIAAGAEEATLLMCCLASKIEPAHDVVRTLSAIGTEEEGDLGRNLDQASDMAFCRECCGSGAMREADGLWVLQGR